MVYDPSSIQVRPMFYHTHHGFIASPYIDIDDIFNDPNIILDDFFINPYATMTKSQTSRALTNFLKTYDDRVITAMLEEVLKCPRKLLIETARHYRGFQVIKELIRVSKELPLANELPKKLAGAFSYIMESHVGRIVIEQCFKQLDIFPNTPLYDVVNHYWMELACHKYGCITLNNCIDSMKASPWIIPQMMKLLENIAEEAEFLAQNEYGIFVLQKVVPISSIVPWFNQWDKKIVEQLKPLYETLCKSRRGSYLMEKYLTTSFRTSIAEDLIQTNLVVAIALDEFGNYIIQKLLKETMKHNPFMYGRLQLILWEELNKIECSPYGWYIAKILREYIEDM